MGFYEQRILPKLIDGGMRNKVMAAERPKVAALAEKHVLEIGMGSGLNIPHYTDKVERLSGTGNACVINEDIYRSSSKLLSKRRDRVCVRDIELFDIHSTAKVFGNSLQVFCSFRTAARGNY